MMDSMAKNKYLMWILINIAALAIGGFLIIVMFGNDKTAYTENENNITNEIGDTNEYKDTESMALTSCIYADLGLSECEIKVLNIWRGTENTFSLDDIYIMPFRNLTEDVSDLDITLSIYNKVITEEFQVITVAFTNTANPPQNIFFGGDCCPNYVSVVKKEDDGWRVIPAGSYHRTLRLRHFDYITVEPGESRRFLTLTNYMMPDNVFKPGTYRIYTRNRSENYRIFTLQKPKHYYVYIMHGIEPTYEHHLVLAAGEFPWVEFTIY